MLMKKYAFYLLLLSLFVALTACGGDESSDSDSSAKSLAEAEATEDREAPAGMQEAMEQLNQMSQQMNGGEGAVEPVNFRELKDLMPSSAAGMDRTSHTGETSKAMGFSLSNAIAKYEEDDQQITLTITDLGGVQMLVMGMAAWTAAEIDRESDDGYERTTTFGGHKAYEKYNSKSQRGEMTILMGNRFIVQAEGRNVPMDALKEAIQDTDLDALADLGQE
jgi:hypothetical protein